MWFKEPKYAWFIVSFLWLFGFLGSIGRIIVQYYQGPITQELDISRGFLGYAWSASILIGSFCAPFGGWLTDKYGYKMTMIMGSVLGVISAAVILVFQHPAGYFIGFGILGGLAGIGASTSYVIVTEWFQHHRAKALMIISSAGSIGLAALTPVFVRNESWLTWMTAYKISIAVGICFIMLTSFIVKNGGTPSKKTVEDSLLKEENLNQTKPRQGLKLINAIKAFPSYLRNPVLVVVIFALFTCGFSMGTVEMHLMAIQQTAHVSHTMFIASLSILGILELVGGFVFAVLLDKMPRAIALGCLYLIRTVAFSILFASLYLSPVLFTLIFGATYLGAIPGGILLAGESIKTKSIGLQTGILLFFHQLGGVAAAITGGLNYDLFHNYQALIAINIALSLVSGIGYIVVHKYAAVVRNRNMHA
ncbi:MFS family permease [Paenibacillus castaneae]|uniref:MFS transporter n=1 Tax=Paenibacillus castaneae TaxID=474957 RepID=UPI000C9B010E|nr:MFS transporter [Paenibacillus castaneae]NIK77797.1 MFS family permease [Paenibacillus castaneae]